MKRFPRNFFLHFLTCLAVCTRFPLGATLLIDNDFGSGMDTGPGFQEINNAFSSPSGNIGSADSSTGVISRGGNFNFVGFNTVSTVDVTTLAPTASGFTATFTVSGTSNFDPTRVDSNGMFFGIVSGTNATSSAGSGIWANDPHAFGYVSSSDNFGDHLVRQDQQAGGNNNSQNNTAILSTAPDSASFADGFTLSISLFDDDTWTISSTGLSTNLNQSGSLDSGVFSYSDIASDVGLFVGFQNSNNSNGSAPSDTTGGNLTIDRISLVAIPEPSTLLMTLMACIGLVFVRKQALR